MKQSLYFVKSKDKPKDKPEMKPLKAKPETISVFKPVIKTRIIPTKVERTFSDRFIRGDDAPLQILNVDSDGLPTIDEIKAHPELLKSQNLQVVNALKAKLQSQGIEEAAVRKATLQTGPALARLDTSIGSISADLAQRLGVPLLQLENSINALPVSIRTQLGNLQALMSAPPPSEGPPPPIIPPPPSDAPSPSGAPPKRRTLPPPPSPKITGVTKAESVTLDALVEELRKGKIYKSEEDFRKDARETLKASSGYKKFSNFDGLIKQAIIDSGRDADEILAQKGGKPVKISGSGLAVKSPVRRGRKSDFVKEVESGVNLKKHFKKFISLARAHKEGDEMSEAKMKKLASYATLNSGGHFNTVFNYMKNAMKSN